MNIAETTTPTIRHSFVPAFAQYPPNTSATMNKKAIIMYFLTNLSRDFLLSSTMQSRHLFSKTTLSRLDKVLPQRLQRVLSAMFACAFLKSYETFARFNISATFSSFVSSLGCSFLCAITHLLLYSII